MGRKIEQEKLAQVLADSANVLVKVASERDVAVQESYALRQKIAAYERRFEAEKLAMDMRDKGMNVDVDFTTLVESLEKKAQEDPEHFRVLQEAVGLTGPDMFKTASIGGRDTASESNDFERFILGDVS